MNELEDIKTRIDIVDLISSYINVKKAGRNYKAVCPFHKEKTPSFMISPDKQIWHCFGCQKGGDVFSFIMEMEGLDFGGALRFLAKKAGVNLTSVKIIESGLNKKSLLFELNNLAASYYHRFLEESPEAQIARDYLIERKVDKATIIEFRLGYAPKSFSKLVNFLQSKGYKSDDIVKAGLAVKKNRGDIADRFYGRLMFPIINPAGAALGFTARILTDEKVAKYINTPETEIYEKSKVLFGLDKAKREILEKKWVSLVEGNMDVVSSWQNGVKNVVASSGTALTRDQIKIIKRYTSNIIFALDKDDAGSEALKRGIFLALEEGANIKIADLGEFKDPDEMIKADNLSWKKSLKESKPCLDFYFDKLFGKISKLEQDVTFKKKVASEILPFLKRMQNSIEASYYIQTLASKIQVPESSIIEALKKIKLEKHNEPRKTQGKVVKKTAEKITTEALLGLLLSFPVTLEEFISLLEDEDFQNQDRQLFHALKQIFEKNRNFNLKDINDEELKPYASILMFITEEGYKDADNDEIFKEAKFCYKRLKEFKITVLKEELRFRIKEEESKNSDNLHNLMKEFQEILEKEKEIKEF